MPFIFNFIKLKLIDAVYTINNVFHDVVTIHFHNKKILLTIIFFDCIYTAFITHVMKALCPLV